MDKNLQYSRVCTAIAKAISKYIPRQYIDVMFDHLNREYIVSIKNHFGSAQYRFLWSTVMQYGTEYIVDVIKHDFVFASKFEE